MLSFILTLPEPPRVVLIASRANFTRFGTEDKATPNWTLVSRSPFLENMMRAGGVFVLLNMINFGAQTLHPSTGKKSFRTLQNVVAQSKCMPIISFLNATIMIVSKISTKG